MESFNKKIYSFNSLISGTAICAAAVGVSALLSATKSEIVKSISWPTAEMIGIFEANMLLATISSLKAQSSSIDPPPLPTINRSANIFLLKYSIADAI